MKHFELGFYCVDNGDGSVSVTFVPEGKEVAKLREPEEGFGEPSAGSLNLRVTDEGILEAQYYDWERTPGKCWKPVKEIS